MKNKLFLLFLIITLATLNSCYQNTQEIVITDFSHSVIDTLRPFKKAPYTAALMEIEGHSNDTVIISFYNFKRKFSGNFKKSVNMDYYGLMNVEFKFDPYKATNEEIKISYSIK